MKKFIVPLIALLVFISCAKQGTQQPDQASSERSQIAGKALAVDVTKAMADFQTISRANKTRLEKLNGFKGACMNNIQVPRDFATIQEAVDNACDGAVIIVNTGTYTEVVVVETPGLKLKANGDVTLNGGFALLAGADNVDIQNFTIVIGATNTHGINGRDVTGGKIFQNTITDPAHKGGIAIRYFNGNDITVHSNHISGTGWGILFGSTVVNGGSHNNTISNNHITGMTFGSVIGLQGNCDNNFINENTLENNPTLSNAGLMLLSGATVGGDCDNNVVKNNISTNNYIGAWLLGGTNNKIGPYNTLNNNRFYGLNVTGAATGNTIFENTAQGNGLCDIVNGAIDPLGNTFTNNIATCTIGL
jgi:hypothetical protein